MDYQSFKNAVIAQAEAMGIAEYELYYESGSDTSVSVFQHEVNGFSCSEGGGVCFRCIVNGKMGYASTQALNEEEAKAIVRQAADNAAGLVAVAVVSDGKEMANSFEIKLGELSKLDNGKMTAKAAADAKRKLGGEPPVTGVYPVVFDPEAMSDLLSVFSSIFSSENAQKGLSRLGDQEGQVIAAPCVTLVDDPFHKDAFVQSNFDSEGCPTRKKNVIEGGTLNTLLYNMKTAAVAGKETTGNAGKAGYDGMVNVRPFTMYLEAGEYTEEELLAKAGNGILINSLQGLHAGANAISGDFSLQSAGYLIVDGKKGDYVKSFTVAGNFYDLLKNITALSDKVVLPNPMGFTTFGSPYVLVENLSIAGK